MKLSSAPSEITGTDMLAPRSHVTSPGTSVGVTGTTRTLDSLPYCDPTALSSATPPCASRTPRSSPEPPCGRNMSAPATSDQSIAIVA